MSAADDRRKLALGAVGSALGRRARGVDPGELGADNQVAPLKPAQAIEALLAGLRALFDLAPAAVAELLAPALVPWSRAVGCADRVLVAGNAAREPALLPLPFPSWCAHAIDAQLLRLEGAPRLEGDLIVQRAWLVATRGAGAPEAFAIDFAARRAETSPHVHLAISQPSSSEYRGASWLRAAASGLERRLPIWLGEPSNPRAASSRGTSGLTVATLIAAEPPPRWAVLRLLEDDEPQALWDLRALRRARLGRGREPGTAAIAAEPARLRLALHLGSTATTLLEQVDASCGAIGGELLGEGLAPSGFLLLAGDPDSAHRYGCAPRLQSTRADVPSSLCAAGPEVLEALLRGEPCAEQLWLAQAGAEPGPALRLERFTSPAQVEQAEWLPRGAPDAEAACGRLLEAYGGLLGRALASAHAAPLTGSEGGRFVERWPRLEEAECVVAFAQATGADRARAQGFVDALAEGLGAAWTAVRVRLVAREAAIARADFPSREEAGRFPIQLDAHLGSQQLRLAVRLPASPGRAPFAIPGSAAVYQLGAERLLEAASFASARARGEPSREQFRETLARLRRAGEVAAPRAEAHAIRETLLRWTIALLQRQLAGTLRAAAPDGRGLLGAGIQLRLSGAGWNLLALDVPAAERELETSRLLQRAFAEPALFAGAPSRFTWLSPRRLCDRLLRSDAEMLAIPMIGVPMIGTQMIGTPMIGTPTSLPGGGGEPLPELLGIDTASGLRWFARAPREGSGALREAIPGAGDAWWRDFTEGIEGPLLRADQWFAAQTSERAQGSLAGGQVVFSARRSLLKQWLDLCGPSLFALHTRTRLASPRA